MKLKVNCIECGIEFEFEWKTGKKTGFCSDKCRYKRALENNRKWRKTPNGKECAKNYRNSEKGKAARKRYESSEKGKVVQKRYFAKPEIKEKSRICARKYYEENREEQLKKRKERYLKQKGEFYELSDEDQLRLIYKRSMEILNGRKKS